MEFVFELLIFAWTLINFVNCRHCTYIYDSGHITYFVCEPYEFCCGTRCCRSHPVTFYQVWYFWLIVFMTLLLCSGGSWWYRFHNRDTYISSAPVVITARPIPNGQSGGVSYGTPTCQQYYPQPSSQHVQQGQQQQVPPPPTCAPPPYYDAPPSYASVANRAS